MQETITLPVKAHTIFFERTDGELDKISFVLETKPSKTEALDILIDRGIEAISVLQIRTATHDVALPLSLVESNLK